MTTLAQLATQCVEELEQQRPALQTKLAQVEAKLREMEAEKRQIQTQLDAVNLARPRLANYTSQRWINYECPRCWIHDEVALPMATVGASYVEDNPLGHDAFKCRCGIVVLLTR